jgi:hypothetical protein
MDGFLTQERDRSLFGLPNKAEKGKNEIQKWVGQRTCISG